MKRDKLYLLIAWVVVAVLTFVGWPLFLHLGPFRGNLPVVGGFLSTVCGAYVAAGLVTMWYVTEFLGKKEDERLKARAAVEAGRRAELEKILRAEEKRHTETDNKKKLEERKVLVEIVRETIVQDTKSPQPDAAGANGAAAVGDTSSGQAAVRIVRESENFRGFIRMKIGAINEGEMVITDCRLWLLFDCSVLRLARVEPSLPVTGEEIALGNINPGERKTVSVYLDPLMCTSTFVDAVLTCRDGHGNIQTGKMRPKEVEVRCPLFFTEDEANTAMLRNLVSSELEHQDSKVFDIPQDLETGKAFELAKSVMSGRDVKLVREFTVPEPFVAEAWYYGVTKVRKMQVVMKVSVREETSSIELFAAARSAEAITGLLAELGHDLTEKMKKKGITAGQVTNITIKDSIINRSSLLFGPGPGDDKDGKKKSEGTDAPVDGGEGEGENGGTDDGIGCHESVTYRIEDSIIHKSRIGENGDGTGGSAVGDGGVGSDKGEESEKDEGAGKENESARGEGDGGDMGESSRG